MEGQNAIAVAITGASGVIYGIELIRSLIEKGLFVNLVISPVGGRVIKEELGLDWTGEDNRVEDAIKAYYAPHGKSIRYYSSQDLFSPLSSGSSLIKAMVICPCSMGTLGRIASGISSNLIERVADVVLKERGRLIIVPRETPLNTIHLENMLKLSREGVSVLPAMPAFYHRPEGIQDLVDFIVGKILDHLGIENRLFHRWRG